MTVSPISDGRTRVMMSAREPPTSWVVPYRLCSPGTVARESVPKMSQVSPAAEEDVDGIAIPTRSGRWARTATSAPRAREAVATVAISATVIFRRLGHSRGARLRGGRPDRGGTPSVEPSVCSEAGESPVCSSQVESIVPVPVSVSAPGRLGLIRGHRVPCGARG